MPSPTPTCGTSSTTFARWRLGGRPAASAGKFPFHLHEAGGRNDLVGAVADLIPSSTHSFVGACLGADKMPLREMAASQSWQIRPSLSDLQAVMIEVGAAKTVLAIYFRNPYVLDDESGLKDAGAILATFGVSDTAILEVISGRFTPRGKQPFALARTLQAVVDNEPDVPGYPAGDTLYPLKFGLSY